MGCLPRLCNQPNVRENSPTLKFQTCHPDVVFVSRKTGDLGLRTEGRRIYYPP